MRLSRAVRLRLHDLGERQGILRQKDVRAIAGGQKSQLEMAKVLQKPVFALPGCQQIDVNTLCV